jgi:hypothetical protein
MSTNVRAKVGIMFLHLYVPQFHTLSGTSKQVRAGVRPQLTTAFPSPFTCTVMKTLAPATLRVTLPTLHRRCASAALV